ncbi:MAG: stage III sporulation protein AE [Clostridia bacterium]|nr:stage III sporulation protein AE [Clostridia bacterium]
MKKKRYIRKALAIILAASIISVLQIAFFPAVRAEEKNNEKEITDELINEQSNSNDIKNLEHQINKHAENDFKELVGGFDPQKIINETAKGKFEFSVTGFMNRSLQYLFKEIYINIDILIKLIILIILCAILKNLQTSFLSESVGELAFYACYIVIVSILIAGFNTAMQLGKEIIDSMVAFMHATIPVLITLLISGGSISSAGIFQPILITIVEVSATIIKNTLLPLIFLATVLSIVDNISDKVQISRLAGLLKQIGAWIMGIVLTVFIAVVSIQGTLGAVVDGVTSKTAKFAIGAFIPVAGKYLADAADAVIGCTLLIKNAAGAAAMLGVLAICVVPLLKIVAIMILYRLACAIVEPVAEKRITNCISSIAGSLTYIIGVVASVAFMFLISITAIISAGNVTAMIR